MSGPDEAKRRWREALADLRAYRENRRELWGDVDDITLALYVEDVCSDDERRAVELAMERKPAIRELVEFLRDMLSSVWTPQPAASLVPGVSIQPSRLVLRERLQVWLDNAGQMMASGVEFFLGPIEPPMTAATLPVRTRGSGSGSRHYGRESASEGASAAQEFRWQIPVDEKGYHLSLGFKCVASPERWHVRCEIFSRGDPGIAERTRLRVAQSSDSPVVQSTLARLAGKYVELASGEWEFAISVDDDVRVLPVTLGSPLA